jgi:hypothetical protein
MINYYPDSTRTDFENSKERYVRVPTLVRKPKGTQEEILAHIRKKKKRKKRKEKRK